MTRTLYRIYLYLVLTSLLSFAAGATATFLGTTLRAAGLDGSNAPSPAETTQATARAIVSWVVVLIFGGLHYWLIRRDIAADAKAASGTVRSLFLNWSELQAAVVTAVAGAIALSNLGRQNQGASSALGFALAFGALFAFYEFERRRAQPAPGAAIILQRLHVYGAQLILLFIATAFVIPAVQQTAMRMLIAFGAVADPCQPAVQANGGCNFDTGQYLGNLWLAALWAVAAWIFYRALAPRDVASRLRVFFSLAGLAYAVILAVIGVQRGAEVLLRQILGAPDQSYPYYDAASAAYNTLSNRVSFAAPLLFGVVAAAVYLRWLARDARAGDTLNVAATRQAILAVAAALTAIAFWVACALLLDDMIERTVSDGGRPELGTWAMHGGLLVAGLAYIPLALYLRQLAAKSKIHTPRRAFVFALLALGTLAGVISLILLLYTLVSQALGSPLNGWESQARQAAANVVVAALVVVLYASLARIEGWFGQSAAAPAVPAPPSQPLDPVDAILAELLAGKLTREQAASQIRALYGPAANAHDLTRP
jgi:hypothetical protein